MAWALAGCDPHSSVTCASSIFGGFAAKFAEACQDPIRFLETRYDVMCPACVMGYKSAIAMQKIVTRGGSGPGLQPGASPCSPCNICGV